MKKYLLKTAAILLIFTTLCVSIFVPASASSTSQMRDEIEKLEEESAKLEKEIAKLKSEKAEQQKLKDSLNAQITNTQREISACTKLINSYKSEIKEYEAEIAAKEAEIEDTKFLFRQRMRSIYMSGSTNNDLLVLLDAENFSDYRARTEVSRTSAADDQKIVDSTDTETGDINESKKAINENNTAQNAIKQTLA